MKLQWTKERAGKWLGLDDHGNEVMARRVSVGTFDYYWVVYINREYVGQEDSLGEAKRFGTKTLAAAL